MSSKIVKIVVCQPLPIHVKNEDRLCECISSVLSTHQGCDLVIFPEHFPDGKLVFSDYTSSDEHVLSKLSKIVRKYKCYCILGSVIEVTKEGRYNTCIVYNRNGELSFTHRKKREHAFLEGKDDGIFVTDFAQCVVLICLEVSHDDLWDVIFTNLKKREKDELVFVFNPAWIPSSKFVSVSENKIAREYVDTVFAKRCNDHNVVLIRSDMSVNATAKSHTGQSEFGTGTSVCIAPCFSKFAPTRMETEFVVTIDVGAKRRNFQSLMDLRKPYDERSLMRDNVGYRYYISSIVSENYRSFIVVGKMFLLAVLKKRIDLWNYNIPKLVKSIDVDVDVIENVFGGSGRENSSFSVSGFREKTNTVVLYFEKYKKSSEVVIEDYLVPVVACSESNKFVVFSNFDVFSVESNKLLKYRVSNDDSNENKLAIEQCEVIEDSKSEMKLLVLTKNNEFRTCSVNEKGFVEFASIVSAPEHCVKFHLFGNTVYSLVTKNESCYVVSNYEVNSKNRIVEKKKKVSLELREGKVKDFIICGGKRVFVANEKSVNVELYDFDTKELIYEFRNIHSFDRGEIEKYCMLHKFFSLSSDGEISIMSFKRNNIPVKDLSAKFM